MSSRRPIDVVIVGPLGRPADAKPFSTRRIPSMPRRSSRSSPSIPRTGRLPTVPTRSGKPALDGRSAAYVCRGFTCSPPVADPAELISALSLSACVARLTVAAQRAQRPRKLGSPLLERSRAALPRRLRWCAPAPQRARRPREPRRRAGSRPARIACFIARTASGALPAMVRASVAPPLRQPSCRRDEPVDHRELVRPLRGERLAGEQELARRRPLRRCRSASGSAGRARRSRCRATGIPKRASVTAIRMSQWSASSQSARVGVAVHRRDRRAAADARAGAGPRPRAPSRASARSATRPSSRGRDRSRTRCRLRSRSSRELARPAASSREMRSPRSCIIADVERVPPLGSVQEDRRDPIVSLSISIIALSSLVLLLLRRSTAASPYASFASSARAPARRSSINASARSSRDRARQPRDAMLGHDHVDGEARHRDRVPGAEPRTIRERPRAVDRSAITDSPPSEYRAASTKSRHAADAAHLRRRRSSRRSPVPSEIDLDRRVDRDEALERGQVGDVVGDCRRLEGRRVDRAAARSYIACGSLDLAGHDAGRGIGTREEVEQARSVSIPE